MEYKRNKLSKYKTLLSVWNLRASTGLDYAGPAVWSHFMQLFFFFFSILI